MGIGGRHVSAIILYGSFARGDFHEGSDLARGRSRAVPQSRAAAILGLPVEPFCYTEEEFAEPVRSPNPFIHQALAEGVRV
jgi:hypothetical protein